MIQNAQRLIKHVAVDSSYAAFNICFWRPSGTDKAANTGLGQDVYYRVSIKQTADKTFVRAAQQRRWVFDPGNKCRRWRILEHLFNLKCT